MLSTFRHARIVAVSTVAEAFALALQHLHAGDLRQSEQVCQLILNADPANADTHHLLGILASQSQGKLDEAISHYQQALQFRPEFAEAHSNLGNAFFLKQNLHEAVGHYKQALRLKPDYLEAHNNLGLALAGQGEWDEAINHYRQALRLNPNSAETHNNLGGALLERGTVQEAIVCFEHAIRLKPDYARAHYNLGVALARQDRFGDAIRCYQQALRLEPNSPEALCNLGLALEQQGRFEEAMGCYRQAVQIRPNYAEAWNNLGLALERQDNLKEALRCYQQALQSKPNAVEACTNLGNIHWEEGRCDEALACYDQALSWNSELPETHFNRARLRLLQGDWAQGWPEYEWRWKTKECPGWSFPQPHWDGTNLAGRTILLLAEQGLGDTLHFIRYAPLVKRRGGTVIVECQPALIRILSSIEGIDSFVPRGLPLPEFDVHASLLSLPGLFHTTMENLPVTVPYLHTDPGLIEDWLCKMSNGSRLVSGTSATTGVGPARQAGPTPVFKVGIAWQGNPLFIGDQRRSIPLVQFAPLAAVPGVQLISLQKGAGSEQLLNIEGEFQVLDLGSQLDEASGAFMETAAVMKYLDLVITSDTAIAHLAGALAIPVWVALSIMPDWRWMLRRHDSPWYPTMRLFRQKRRGQWPDVFAQMAEELTKISRSA
jgi:tetratricopeptide (TPR) repeat protein